MNSTPRLLPRRGLIGLLFLALLSGCASTAPPPGYRLIKPTVVDVAQQEIPEDQLLDVGVAVTQPRELSEQKMEKLGTNDDIRRSECHFVPVHLESTLQTSNHWGAVRVVPPENGTSDLTISTELVKSNGEVLQLVVEARDASGRRWLSRKYHAVATEQSYNHTAPGERDAFQDLYNTIANDLAEFKRSLSPADIEQLRTISKLEFARSFAPEAFGDYLTEDANGDVSIQHLPADDDPLMARIEMIRDRDDMFVDTLNAYYEGFYVNMWDAYDNWRRYNLVEQVALRRVEEEAFFRTLGGIMMIAAAIALQVGDVGDLDALSGILVLAGGQIMIGGINVSEQSEIHAAAIQELGDSFASEMQPTILKLEGKQYELTGTAQEQFDSWRELLRMIYEEETGFGPPMEQFGDIDGSPQVPADS